MKFFSALPYTPAERQADQDRCWQAIQRAIIRRQAAPRGKYDIKPNETDKRLWKRRIGELDD